MHTAAGIEPWWVPAALRGEDDYDRDDRDDREFDRDRDREDDYRDRDGRRYDQAV